MSESAPQNSPSIYEIISYMLEQIAQVSWSKLGLQPDIITGKLETNLTEAKVGIDLVVHLASVLEPQLDEEDRRRIHGMVRDLRINYVQKTREVDG